MKLFQSIKAFFINIFQWFKKASLKKKIAVGIGLVLIVWIATSPLRKDEKKVYVFESAKRGTIVDIVSETGNSTTGRVSIPSTSNGVIKELYVQNGDSVVAGDKLFMVKSTATPQEKATAYANYQNAVSGKNTSLQNKPLYQSQLEAARKQVIDTSNAVNIMNDIRNNGGVNPSTKKQYTQEEIDSINSALTSARQSFSSIEQKYLDADATIQASQATLTSTWIAYQATQDSTVVAPISGTVGNLLAHVGDNVSINATSPVLVIGNLENQYVMTEVNEVDRPKIKVGQKAKIDFSAIKDTVFEGTVLAVDVFGTDTSSVITYRVSLSVSDKNGAIAPGMTANIDIETNKRDDVLTVPNTAIKPYQGGKAVQVLDRKTNKPKYIPVKIGLKGVTHTEIISGITEGTKIITGKVQTIPGVNSAK